MRCKQHRIRREVNALNKTKKDECLRLGSGSVSRPLNCTSEKRKNTKHNSDCFLDLHTHVATNFDWAKSQKLQKLQNNKVYAPSLSSTHAWLRENEKLYFANDCDCTKRFINGPVSNGSSMELAKKRKKKGEEKQTCKRSGLGIGRKKIVSAFPCAFSRPRPWWASLMA